MKTTSSAASLVALLFFCSVLAQDSGIVARKVTVSLTTGVPSGPADPRDDRSRASPVFETIGEIMPVAASIVAVESLAASIPQRRRIEYSEDQIVVVGLAADATERTRTVILDPRLIRAEALRGENDLPSNRLYRKTVDFSVALDDPAVVKIRIQKPRWNGSAWLFDVLAEAPIE